MKWLPLASVEEGQGVVRGIWDFSEGCIDRGVCTGWIKDWVRIKLIELAPEVPVITNSIIYYIELH